MVTPLGRWPPASRVEQTGRWIGLPTQTVPDAIIFNDLHGLLVTGQNPGQFCSGGLSATADNVWQIGHVWLTRNAEPVAEVVPECDAKFGGGAHQSEECIAEVASIDTACAAADRDMEADVALGAIGVERYPGAIEHHQQLGLVGVQPREQATQRDEA